jgi:hypothetical protein
MYNMEISIGSSKCRLEILILIIVALWILFGHLLCSCCTISLKEGLTMVTGGYNKNYKNYKNYKKEGFVGGNNTAYGPEFSGAKTPDYIMNPSTWAMPTLTYSPGTTPSAGVQAIWDRPKQPVPLPKDELDMFATTQFKPECCPNAFSSSTGCACMTVEQLNYLNLRGGNNVPYSQY